MDEECPLLIVRGLDLPIALLGIRLQIGTPGRDGCRGICLTAVPGTGLLGLGTLLCNLTQQPLTLGSED
jgi:hypothetical protein